MESGEGREALDGYVPFKHFQRGFFNGLPGTSVLQGAGIRREKNVGACDYDKGGEAISRAHPSNTMHERLGYVGRVLAPDGIRSGGYLSLL